MYGSTEKSVPCKVVNTGRIVAWIFVCWRELGWEQMTLECSAAHHLRTKRYRNKKYNISSIQLMLNPTGDAV